MSSASTGCKCDQGHTSLVLVLPWFLSGCLPGAFRMASRPPSSTANSYALKKRVTGSRIDVNTAALVGKVAIALKSSCDAIRPQSGREISYFRPSYDFAQRLDGGVEGSRKQLCVVLPAVLGTCRKYSIFSGSDGLSFGYNFCCSVIHFFMRGKHSSSALHPATASKSATHSSLQWRDTPIPTTVTR